MRTTLYRHAQILTADSDWRFFPDGAMLVMNDTVGWVGADSDLAAVVLHPFDEEIDLSGYTVIPGLINTHAHGGLSLFRGLCDDGDLFQWAKTIAPTTSLVTKDLLRFGCYLAIFEQVQCGTTCTCDCTRFGVGIFAEAAGKVGLRSLSGALVNSPNLRPLGKPYWPGALHDTERAMRAYAESSRTRFFLGAHSIYSCTSDLLKTLKAEADRLRVPFNIHVAETRKEVEDCLNEHGMPPVAYLDKLGVLDANTLIDHGVWLNECELDVLQARQLAVAHCPISNAKLGSGIAPVPDLLRRGLTIGLGTDSTMSNNAQDLFAEMKFAVLLQRAHHTDGRLLSAREAFKMASIDAARALGWEDEIGSLEPGKKADFCVLELPEPKAVTAEQVESDIVYLGGRHLIRQVVVEGTPIYRNGEFLMFDQDTLLSEMNQAFQRSIQHG